MIDNALIIIDMQRDFVPPRYLDRTRKGALEVPDTDGMVERIGAKLKLCRERGDRVIFTLDSHAPDEATIESRTLPRHCTDKYGRSCIYDTAGGTVIEKSTFAAPGLAEYLYDCKHAELVGVCTDVCVISNALMLRSLLPSLELTVDSACTAGTSLTRHAAALEVMRSCLINVI